MIGFLIQSLSLWWVLSSRKSWYLLIPSESQKKSFNCALLYFFSGLYHSRSSVYQTIFGGIWKNIRPLPLESKFSTFWIFTFIFSEQYISADISIIWFWRIIMAFMITFLLGQLYVFTGLSVYLFSDDVRRGQHRCPCQRARCPCQRVCQDPNLSFYIYL